MTRDPEGRATQSGTMVTRYTLALERRSKEKEADFVNIVAFNKGAEFAEKYFTKGMRVAVTGRIQTGSYTNKDGIRIPTFEVVADTQEFADGKAPSPKEDEFMDITGELPWND